MTMNAIQGGPNVSGAVAAADRADHRLSGSAYVSPLKADHPPGSLPLGGVDETYELARSTAQRTLAVLREKDLIYTVPQSGGFVRKMMQAPSSWARCHAQRSRAGTLQRSRVPAPHRAGGTPSARWGMSYRWRW